MRTVSRLRPTPRRGIVNPDRDPQVSDHYRALIAALRTLEAEMRADAKTNVSVGWAGFVDRATEHWADRLAAELKRHA